MSTRQSIVRALFSIKSTIFLLTIFILSIAAATFIENDFGRQTARAVVYSATWFRVLFLLLSINLVGAIIERKLWRAEKWTILLFHSSLLIILIGGGITTYKGYEGLMHIREGEVSNSVVSTRSYITISLEDETGGKIYQYPILVSKITQNRFNKKIFINGKKINIKLIKYIPDARREVVEDESGTPCLVLIISKNGGVENVILRESEIFKTPSLTFSFNKNLDDSSSFVQFKLLNGRLCLISNRKVKKISMRSNKDKIIHPQEILPFEPLTLYQIGNTGFALKRYIDKGKIRAVANQIKSSKPGSTEEIDALVVNIRVNERERSVSLFGREGTVGREEEIEIGGIKMTLSYGSKEIPLKFGLRLERFKIERYPGSRMVSSYSSHVTILDDEKNIKRPYRIYMNHILKYRGMRFFQYSYDPDEKGTILLVSHDPGTPVTYAGYSLLIFGLIVNILNPHTRLRRLLRMLNEHKPKGLPPSVVFLLIFTLTTLISSQANGSNKRFTNPFGKKHCSLFGSLLVQDGSGRVKPINSLAYEVANKISYSRRIGEFDPVQALLGIFLFPESWKEEAIIRVDHSGLNKIIGIDKEKRYVSYSQLTDSVSGVFKLAEKVHTAMVKPPSLRTKREKKLLELYKIFRYSEKLFGGSLFRIFPVPGDSLHQWVGPNDLNKIADKQFRDRVIQLIERYRSSVLLAVKEGKWEYADSILEEIRELQRKLDPSVSPSRNRIFVEIVYNKSNIFASIIPLYYLTSLIMIILLISRFYIQSEKVDIICKILFVVILAGFLLHTAGLAVRWYVSGHAPWSNKYESMIYIAWSSVLAGLFLSRTTSLPASLGALFSAFVLDIAHSRSVDPAITNLVPVLKSPWLIIHVSVTCTGYGFFAVSAITGLITLILFILKRRRNEDLFCSSIKRLTMINEIGLLIGLTLITAGNFLGAVWANESWGRYWGWDPKETWTLITILVYTVVLHIRFTKVSNKEYTHAVASIIGFGSVVMTYFGVNYYLSGLHSYAGGDAPPLPFLIYIITGIILTLIILSYKKRKIT